MNIAHKIITLIGVLITFYAHTQAPDVTPTVPAEGFVGEQQCFPVTFENNGPTGYNPYMRLFIPAGITFDNASFNGAAATITNVGVLPATPIKDPVLNTGTASDSITGPAGETLIILQVPVGSLVDGGPTLSFEVCVSVDAGATVGTPVDLDFQGVYELGDTPTGANGPIFGSVETGSIIPRLFTFDKTGPGVTNPGGGLSACNQYTYTLDVDIAAGGTLNGPIIFQDVLDANLTYLGSLTIPAGCTATEPVVGSTGGTLSVNCNGAFPGSLAASDMTVTYLAAVGDVLDETVCSVVTVNNNASFTVPGNPVENDMVTTAVEHLTLGHSNDAAGPVAPGATVNYSISATMTEYTAGVNAGVITFVVPDGMSYNPASLLWNGMAVAPANVTVTPTPSSTGSTVVVNIHAQEFANSAANILPCATSALTYSANVEQNYFSGAPVLTRDDLSHTSSINYGLVEGATGCVSNSSTGLGIQNVTFTKTVVNSPPNVTINEWLPGDIVQYRLEMKIPGGDANAVKITDFFPLPVHDVTDLDPIFGTDVRFDPAVSCWSTAPVNYTRNAALNALELDFGDISDLGTGSCVDVVLLIDIPITTIPFADNLSHSNFMRIRSDNTISDGSQTDKSAVIPIRAPALTDFEKNIVASNNPNATISSGNISGVDAADTIRFEVVTTNKGGAYAYDVQVRDVVPASLTNCALDPTTPSTFADGTVAPFVGGFIGNNLTLDLTGTLEPDGQPKFAFTTRYYCVVTGAAQPLELSTNAAEMDWASAVASPKFPAIKADANITIADLAVEKTIDTIFPSKLSPRDVVVGDFVTYKVAIDIPEGELKNVNILDRLDLGLAFVKLDNITATAGITSSLGSFASLIGTEVYSGVGISTKSVDREMSINFGDITNTDTDNTTKDQIIITYTTTVLNIDNNNRGDRLNNRFDVFWDNPNAAGTLSERGSAPTVKILEPGLQVTKSFLDDELIPGQQTFVTLNVAHIPTSDASAYDVSFSDTLKLGLNYVSGSNVLSGSYSATPVIGIAGNVINVDIDSLAVGENITLVFKVEVDAAFPTCDTIQNCAYLNYESLLDAVQVGLPVAINNTFVGERTGKTSDVGGAFNIYADTSCVNMFTTNDKANDPTITSSGVVCEGEDVQLTVDQYTGSVVTYQWTGPAGAITNNSNILLIQDAAAANVGDYKVVVNVDGCVSDTSQAFNLVINEKPNVAPTNNGALCMNPTLDLVLTSNATNGTTPYTYAWTGPNGYTSIGANPIIPNPTSAHSGTYFVEITDNNGCKAPLASTQVNITDVPLQPSLTNNSPICEGQNLLIEGPTYTGNSVSFAWTGPSGAITNNSNTLNIPNASTTDNGNYQLTVTVDGCTSDPSSLSATVNANPAALAPTSSTPDCDGDTIFLLANNGTGNTYSYTWTGPNGFSSNLENPTILDADQTDAGFYTLAISDANGCSASTTIQTVVKEKPTTAAISESNIVVCEGETLNLNSGSSYSGAVLYYIWTTPTDIDSTTVPTYTIPAAALTDAGNYSLVVEVDGCRSNGSSQTNVQVIANTVAPNITANNTSLCEDETLILSSSTVATTYNWTGPNGFTSNVQNPTAIVVNANSAGTYSLVTSNNGCNSPQTDQVITVNAKPTTPILTASNAICNGDDIVLSTTSVATSYNWIAPNGTVINNATNPFTIASGNANYLAGDWKLSVVDANACVSNESATQVVVINTAPTAIANNNGPICSNSDVMLMGNSVNNASYQWYNETYTSLLATSENYTVNNLTAGSYTYNYIVNVNGCVDTATTVVTVDAVLAAPNITANPNPVCSGELFELSSTTAADSYSWNGPNGFTSTSQTPPGLIASTLTAGDYTLSTVVAGCGSSTATVSITVEDKPTTPVLTATNTICNGDDIVLSTTATGTTFNWIAPNGTVITNATNTLTVANTSANYLAGDWTLTVVNAAACVSEVSNTETVTINQIPFAFASNNGSICSGSDVTLTGNTQAGGTYEWLNAAGTMVLATGSEYTVSGLTANTTYTYRITVNGCSQTAQTTVVVNAVPTAPNITANATPVCEGETFTISSTTVAAGYAWTGPNGFTSNAQNPTAIIASTNTAGTYSLVVTDANGCESVAATQAIVVNAKPEAPVLTATNEICLGDDIVLSTTATGTTFNWIAPNGTVTTNATNTFTVASTSANYLAGDWTLTVVNAAACVSEVSNTETVTINQIPFAFASNNGSICSGSDVVLTGNTQTGGTYEWLNAAGTMVLATGSEYTVSGLTANTTYTYRITVNGCSQTAQTTVVVNAVPTAPNITANATPVCEGETFTISSTTVAAGYAWTGPNGFTSNAQNPTAIIASTNTAGTYSLVVTDANGCESVAATQAIVVNAKPEAPVLTATNEICLGDDIVLSTTATGTTFNWIAPNGTVTTNAINTLTVASTSANYLAGDWTLTVVNAAACVSEVSNTETVTINQIPFAFASNNGSICSGSDVVLTGNTQAGGTYEWLNAAGTMVLATGSEYTVSGLTANTTYTYRITVNGCSQTAQTTVVVNAVPTAPNITANATPVCEGETFTISSTTTASAYSYTGPNGFTSNVQNPTSIIASTNTAGTYSLVITDANGCESVAATQAIVVNAKPEAPVLTATNEICLGDDIVLSTTATGTTFNWIAPNGTVTTNATNTLTVASTSANYLAGDWTLTVVNAAACVSEVSNTETVTINQIPFAFASNNGSICSGSDVVLTGNTQAGGTYEWLNAAGTMVLATGSEYTVSGLTANTTYTYRITVNGCSQTAQTTVVVNAVPTAPNITANATPVCEGETFTISSTTTASAYSYTGPNGFTSNVQNPTAIIASTNTAGTYSLVITDANGCESVAATQVIVVNAKPEAPVLTATNEICLGDDIVLSTTATGTTFNWIAPNGTVTTNATNTLTVASTSANYLAGDWTLTVVNAAACVSEVSNTETVTINQIPFAFASNNGSICSGSDVTLTGNTQAGGTYEWLNAAGTMVLATGSEYTVSGLTANTTYTYRITVNGCSQTAQTTVVVNAVPTAPNITANATPVCEGETFTISSTTVAAGYAWTGPNGFTSNAQNPTAIIASTNTAGTYSLVVTDANGCESLAATQAIVVNAKPEAPVLTATNEICLGDDIVLSTTATGTTFNWIAPNGTVITNATNTLTVASTSANYLAGDWTLTVVNAAACVSEVSNTETVTINQIPFAFASNNGSICSGSDVVLTGNTQTGGTYEWLNAAGTMVLATGSEYTVSGLTANTTYTYRITVNGCSQTAQTTVVVNAVPTAPNISANATPVCEGETFTISSTTTASAYSYTGPNGFTSNAQNPTAIIASTNTAGTYSLVITDANGCESVAATQAIVVNAKPEAPTVSGNTNLCEGDDIVLTTSSTCDSYQWIGPGGSSPGTLANPVLTTMANTTTIPAGNVAYASGEWSVSCVSADGCASNPSESITITITPLPNAIANNDGPICSNGTVELIGNSVASATYQWWDENYTTLLSTSTNHTVTNLPTGMYTFNYIVNVNGCVDTASTVVTSDPILAAPNVSANPNPVCEGELFELTSTTSADSYTWAGPNGFTSTSQSPNGLVGSSLTAGDYSLTVAIAGCGSSSASITITVEDKPTTPVLTATNAICNGDDIVLSTTATAATYNWIAPDGTVTTNAANTLTVTSTDATYLAGNWTLTVASAAACVSEISNAEEVVINAIPVASATNSSPICNGATATLTGNIVAGASYTWFDATYANQLGTTSEVITGSLTANTDFNYVLNVNGCIDTVTTTVVVNAVPTAPNITANSTPVCEGETFTISSTTVAAGYAWTGPNGFTSNVQNPTAIIASANTAGTYSLVITDANGCESVAATQVIVVDAKPTTPVLTATNTICNGDDIVLSTTATAATYNWIAPDGTVTTNAANTLTVTSTDATYLAGNWTLTVASAAACVSEISNAEEVVINAIPVASVTNSSPICNGATATLTGNIVAGASYTWFDATYANQLGTTSEVITGNLTANTDFNYVLNVNGCIDTVTTTVVVNAVPTAPNITANSTPVCEGETFTISSTTIAAGYAWTGPNGFTSNVQNPTAIIASANTAGTYSLVVTDANGCESVAATQVIVVDAKPTTPVLTATNTICNGDDIVLSTTATAATYNWIAPDGTVTTNAANTLTVTSTDATYLAGNWTLTVASAAACVSEISNAEEVVINAIPVASATNSSPICNGATATLTGNIVAGASYTWFDATYANQLGTTSEVITGNLTANTDFNYVLNVNGCIDTVTTTVVVNAVPTAPNITANATPVCEGETFTISSTTVAAGYAWTGPNGFTSNVQNPTAIIASANTAGTYSLVITDANGCESVAATEVIVVDAKPTTPVLTATNTICNGDDIVLSTTATAATYNWIAPDGTVTTNAANTLTVTSTDATYLAGNWTLTVASAAACVSEISNAEEVVINAIPVASATNSSPICNGATATLTGNIVAGASYTWFDATYANQLGTTSEVITGNLTANTDFNYVLNVNGCIDTVTTTVVVNAVPTAPNITANATPVCEGETFTISSTTVAAGYAWTGPNGFTSNVQNPTAIIASANTAGTYSLVITDAHGCESVAATQLMVVNALPDAPTITGDIQICFGDTLKLETSSICDNYQWIGPGGSSVSTLANPLLTTGANQTAIPSTNEAYAAGEWSVVCVSPDGCSSPQSNTINVNIIPVPDTAVAVSNSPVCEGDNIVLNTNAIQGATYLWSSTTGFSSTDQTPVIVNATLADAGSYEVEIDFQGCSSKFSVPTIVTVNSIPDAPLPTSNSPICEGNTIMLTPNVTADSYFWSGPDGFNSTLENPTINNADIDNEGFYSLVVNIGGCSSPAGQTQVEIVPSSFVPAISVVDDTICVNGVLEIETPGFNGTGAQYVWYGPSGVLATTANPTYIDPSATILDSGEYHVEVLLGTCVSLPSQIALIDVNPNPATPDVTFTDTVCEGGIIQLSTNTMADAYVWSGPNGYNSDLQHPQIIIPAQLFNMGTYSLAVLEGGCYSEDSLVEIVVNPTPQQPVLFNSSPVCFGDTLIVNTPNFATEYEWTYPNSVTEVTNNDTLMILNANTADAGIYELRLIENGCFSPVAQTEVTVDDTSSAQAFAGLDFTVCDQSSIVNLEALDNGGGFWTTNSDATILTPNNPATLISGLAVDSTYEFVWTLTSGSCGGTSSDTVSFYVAQQPMANQDTLVITDGNTEIINVLANDTLPLSVNLSVFESPSNGNVSLYDNSLEYINNGGSSDQFIYEICLEDCPTMCDTAIVDITVKPRLNVPDIITPNGDGSNDGFVIEGIENYPNNEIHIYNRWGNVVFTTSDYQNDWQGTLNNEELPDGTYYYVFVNTATGETILTGYITLHR